MCDVLIVGAGPAGSIAGLVLARAGARVRIVDRAAFPRDKLCGDTINPGTLACLRELGVAERIERCALRVDGMLVTGERGVAIEGRYPRGLSGRAIVRRDFDWALLQSAMAAGCQFESGVHVRRAVLGGARVGGVIVGNNGHERRLEAPVTIAADGRHSTIAFGLGLARHPVRPRRWAIGAYFTGISSGTDTYPSPDVRVGPVAESATVGEMHVRRNWYLGIAEVPGGLTNVCLVRPSQPGDADLRNPMMLLTRTVHGDQLLRDRFADARIVSGPVVLGPLAVDTTDTPIDGLLIAGDAAGFVDPMTGDGLRFAIRGGELAAAAALEALERGWSGVHARLADRRRREFSGKQRFNRALRALVASSRAVSAAAIAARVAPAILQAVIRRAGDCDAVPLA
jgi:flavin-dependent dehydrogenase